MLGAPMPHVALKRRTLAELRRGKITVPRAARRLGVSISAMIAWAKLARIPIPQKYATFRHRPGVEAPTSAARIKSGL